MTISVQLDGSVNFQQKVPSRQGAVGQLNVQAGFAASLLNGVGAGQADMVFSALRGVTSGSADNIDLSGALTDDFGSTLLFVKVKAICIKSLDTNTTNLTVGASGGSGFIGPFADATDAVVLAPGDGFLWYSKVGKTVTPTTADIFKVLNSAGASASYEITFIGTSA